MISEIELSANLGLDRRTVTTLRNKLLTEGEDYVRGSHRKILVTISGQEKLKGHLFPSRYTPETLESVELTGTVTHWKYRNRKIVQVDGEHIVRVSNADNYRPNIYGVAAPISYKELGGKLFEYHKPDKNWRRSQPLVK